MRTTGTFQDVYAAAKAYYSDEDGGCPHNPVVRCEDGKWMLESGLEPTDGEFEIGLETFDNWFCEEYKDGRYVPSAADIEDFVSQMSA